MQKNVIQYLWNTVERVPDKIAVDDNKEQVTFSQLQQSAIKIAGIIRELGLRKNPVGIYIPKSTKMVQAFAGVSLSCNFYVPLDTKSPDARVQSILQVLGAKLIITTAALKDKAEKLKELTTNSSPYKKILKPSMSQSLLFLIVDILEFFT